MRPTLHLLKVILLLAVLLPVGINASAQEYKRYHGDGIDNVLEYVPSAAVFTLKILGVESKSTWQERLCVSVTSMAINAGATYGLKHLIHRTRPDGTDNHSFPSGHTAVAFCGATTLWQEYHKTSPWIGVAGFAVATTVGVDRVRRNRHHWEDVAAGAAIGVLSAQAGYAIGKIICRKTDHKAALSITPAGIGLMVKL